MPSKRAGAAVEAPAAGPPEPIGSVEDRIRAVGADLRSSFGRVIDGLPGEVRRPSQLGALLGLNRDISGRVLSVVRSRDPLAAAHVAPGPEPLRKLLRVARRKDVPADAIEAAEHAVGRFETLIREDAGDRTALDAIISSLLPPAREKFELAAKQTIFKGTSLLKGVMADTWLHAALVHPARETDDRHDVAHVYGTLGLRRVRPDTVVKFTYRQFGTPTSEWRTLDGRAAEDADARELDRFCTLPAAPLDVVHDDDGAVHLLARGGVGPGAVTDKLFAEVRPRAMAKKAAAAARNRKSLFVAPSIPVKELVFDMLLHEDVYPGSDPALVVYDTAVDGMASVNDPARDHDVLDVHESIVVLGRGATRFSLAEMPRYVELLEHAAQQLDWDLDRFRGYRCRVQYPMHGSQVCMVLSVPG